MAITCRVSFRTPWNATSRTLKMPCDSTSWTGTQVANHSLPLVLEQDARRLNALMSRVLRAAPLMLNEQSNILTSTEKPTTSKADPQTKAPIAPRQGNPRYRVTLARNMEWSQQYDSCGFQWRDVDAVTPEFPLDLHNKSRVLSPPAWYVVNWIFS